MVVLEMPGCKDSVNLFVYHHIKQGLENEKLAWKFSKACKLTPEFISQNPIDYIALKDSMTEGLPVQREEKKKDFKKESKKEKSKVEDLKPDWKQEDEEKKSKKLRKQKRKEEKELKKLKKRVYQSSDDDEQDEEKEESVPFRKMTKFEKTEKEIEFESRDKSDVQCYKCQEYGHFSFSCPNTKCYNCQEMGHMSGACPQKRAERGYGRGGNRGGGRFNSRPPPRPTFTGANDIPLGPRKATAAEEQ